MTARPARLRITRRLNSNSAFAHQMEGVAARRLAKALDAIGEEAVRRCDDIVAKELVNDRIPERRRPGRHLLGSFRHEVIWDGRTLPVTIRLYSLADSAKVNAMERGADPHTITAVNAVWLTFPRQAVGKRATSPGALGDTKFSTKRGKPQIQQGYRGQSTGAAMTKVKSVNHPGNLPHSMMKIALNGAINERLQSALRAA